MIKVCLQLIVLFSLISGNSYAQPNHCKPEGIPEIGFTVGSDHKIYKVNLLTGQVIHVSQVIRGLGGLANIAYNSQRQHLYIASDRAGPSGQYDPLVVVDVGTLPFKVKHRFAIEPWFRASDPEKPATNAIYRVIAAAGDKLYVMDAADSAPELTTVLDSLSGKIIGRVDKPVSAKEYFSPDGKMAATMWPGGFTVRNGVKKQHFAGMAVTDLETGEVVVNKQLKASEGFQPPWCQLTSKFLYYKQKSRTLEVYDRSSKQLLSSINIRKLAGLAMNQSSVKTIGDSDLIAVSMTGAEHAGFIVVIDVIKQQIVHKIEIGPWPTNLVLSTQ